MSDIYPKTGRKYEVEAVIQVIASGEFDVEEIGRKWSMVSFGKAVIKKYKELLHETL